MAQAVTTATMQKIFEQCETGVGNVKIWHDAYAGRKICCPHERCRENTAYFQKAGSEQHIDLFINNLKKAQ